MNDINFDKLNPVQLKAVTDTEGPVLVLAGAGSGKTRVLTMRIAYIVKELNVKPYNILAVTFTNKAAGEIKNRLAAYMSENVRHLWAGTFHSICIRMLREYGASPRFSIYDEKDQERALKAVVTSMYLDSKKYAPNNVLPKISHAKEKLVSPEQYDAAIGGRDSRTIARIYEAYNTYLRKNNAYDFDDLIFYAVKLLQNNKEAREHYQNKFRYIHVDEYQDINYSQYLLVSMLADKWKNIFCVGDDDQSIYGWRGADVGIILRYEQDYPNCKIYKLEQNYRSTGKIIKAASEVIKHNYQRNDKNMWTANEDGADLTLINASDSDNEANQVSAAICASRSRNNASWGDYAILYRANYLSRTFEKVLTSNRIKYKIVGGTRFYEREEIKDMIAYLKVVNNPDDDVSLLRIINKPRRRIGEALVSALQSLADQKGVSVFESFRFLDGAEELKEAQKNVVTKFAMLIRGFIKDSEEYPLSQLVKNIYQKSGMQQELEHEINSADNPDIYISKKENIGEFINNAEEYTRETENPSLADFLEQIGLSADIDSYDDESDAVSLMTVHSAKGLEFPYVYIVGLEEGIFPHERSLGDSAQVDEERRLMYVAMTRAEKELTLSYADIRYVNNELKRREKSSFIKYIPRELFGSGSQGAGTSAGSLKELKNRLADADLAGRQKRTYRPGTKVLHREFGKGLVINCQGSGPNEIATVVFDKAGLKKLLVENAGMTKL